jgi:hypothetical protein
MNNDHPQSDLPGLDEDLVAYLDGELDDEAARRLVDRLNHDEGARQRLRALATSWDLLDHLPRAAMDDSFTRTTVQMIAVAASDDIADQKAALPARKRRRWTFGAIGALAAAMVGFVAVVVAWPDPNEPLLRDLPVVKNLDQYMAAKNIDLIRRLDAEGIFSGGTVDSTAASAEADEAQPTGNEPIQREQLLARRAEVENLSPQEKEELRKQFDRFQGLSTELKEQYRAMDAAFQADPDEFRLRSVLEQFHNWLPTLSVLDRAELSEMSTDEAVNKIRQLKQREARTLTAEMVKPLTPGDVEAIEKWIQDRTWRRKNEILSKADDRQRKWFADEVAPDRERRALVLLAMTVEGGPRSLFSDIKDDEWNNLKKTLSKAANNALEKITSVDDQKHELFGWHGRALHARDAVSGGVGRDELMRFFREELEDKMRQEMAFLPPDEFQRRLRWEYFKRKEMPPGSWREPWKGGRGPGRGGRRGPMDWDQDGPERGPDRGRRGGSPREDNRGFSRERDREQPRRHLDESDGD